ncbi:MAG: hypothetical protein H0V76_07255 [Blastocatellia bacterium]|nr:hypothetical protein [Blastocatellia bacterium]
MKVWTGMFLVALLLGTACSRIESKASDESQIPTGTPPPEFDVDRMRPANLSRLGLVKPKLQLSPQQRKYLDESIPPEARKILENAERFDLLGEIDKDESSEEDSRSFVPNRLIPIRTEKDKLEVLEAFYADAAKEDSPAICYEPHHGIRAEFGGETVEIEICFSCARFVLKRGAKEYFGTIVREGRKSEELFELMLKSSGENQQ